LPVIVTRATWPASTAAMNSLKFIGLAGDWNRVEKFHTSTPTTTSAIQKTRLFSVEFKQCPLSSLPPNRRPLLY
jgi:hypothetical protein